MFDIEFLHGCANPTIILIHQDVNGRHIKTHEISLKDKEFTKVSIQRVKPYLVQTSNVVRQLRRTAGGRCEKRHPGTLKSDMRTRMLTGLCGTQDQREDIMPK